MGNCTAVVFECDYLARLFNCLNASNPVSALPLPVFKLLNYQITRLPNPIMDLSKLSPAMISQLATIVEDYITNSRTKYAPQAVPLTEAQRSAMQPYFPAETLENARLCVLHGTRVPNPSMYSMAKLMGIRNLPDFSDMAAITFVDVVVSQEEFTDALLFHELVHVVQYAQMGVSEFASRFVSGFIQGGSYEQVPLEKNAYLLEGRFSENRNQPFSVDDEVRQWREAGKS
jgi:hypothetical protein